MPKHRCWLLTLLLLMMLNHAIVACDSIVVHLPAEHHSLIGFADDATPHHHPPIPAEHQHQLQQAHDQHNGEPHEPHAHVLCFVAYHDQPLPDPKSPGAISNGEPAVLQLALTPPVPPPNV